MNFYIADWHYAHRNVIRLDNRPFSTIEEMNEALINNWNNVVSESDTVYVLGDMFWCRPGGAIPVLERLRGNKVLVRGNHDIASNAGVCSHFLSISEYMEVEDQGRHVVLCHYPIPCFKNHFYGWYHLYGHVHNSFEWEMMEHDRALMESYGHRCEMYNVGCMMPWMNYTPRTLEEIVNGRMG